MWEGRAGVVIMVPVGSLLMKLGRDGLLLVDVVVGVFLDGTWSGWYADISTMHAADGGGGRDSPMSHSCLFLFCILQHVMHFSII